MDILHLKEKVIGLVAYMKEVGYTSQYIWYINHLTKWIVSNSMCYEWQNYADIEHTLAKLWHNKHTFANKSRLLRIVQRYDEEAVQMVLSQNDIPIRSHSFKYSVEYGLKKCVPYYNDGIIEHIMSYLSTISNSRKNIQYLTEAEIEAIKHMLEHDKTISLQDKAIATIALYTGLRSCDISALTMKGFDWEGDWIIITQSKTGTALTLPLRAVVGNAIYDYLVEERPKCYEPYVFLTVNSPYRKLHTSNLNAEFKSLKECALSIENYPVRKEVFYQ